MLAPEAFAAIPNAWGRQGWTTATLSKLGKAELNDALKIAWAHGAAKKAKKRSVAELGQARGSRDRVDVMLRRAFREAAEDDARERARPADNSDATVPTAMRAARSAGNE